MRFVHPYNEETEGGRLLLDIDNYEMASVHKNPPYHTPLSEVLIY